MAFVLEPSAGIGREVRRVVRRQLKAAITLIDELDAADAAQVERVVHDVRKRCKEVRGAARLARPALGDEFAPFNETVRDAAAQLAPIRDAHVMAGTIDRLDVGSPAGPACVHPSAEQIQARVAAARRLLVAARRQSKAWDLDNDFVVVRGGLTTTYRRGRRGLRRAQTALDDQAVHEWRKSVKHLWYQVRLFEASAPSVLRPFADRLDALAEMLGDDHDLAVLITDLSAAPENYGGKKPAKDVRRVARARQAELRAKAIRLGATLFAEKPDAFVARVEAYGERTRRLGPEPAALTPTPAPVADAPHADTADASTVERERKYLVAALPELPSEGVELRQGYLAIDGTVSVRVRDAGGERHTLTIKAGHGAVRTELEWEISDEEFAAAWEASNGRRIHKTRYRIPADGHIVDFDVFHGNHAGLLLAEVEFDSERAMNAFVAPAWFGSDVTDDEAFTNAALATSPLRNHG